MAADAVEQFDRVLAQARDWATVLADLMFVSRVLSEPELAPADGDRYLRRAVWEGAIGAYMRGFNSSSRTTNLRGLIAGLDDEQKRLHESVERWRNKHAAHHDRSGYVRSRVRLDPTGDKGLKVGVDLSIQASPPDAEWLALAALADDLADKIKSGKLQKVLKKLDALWPQVADQLEYEPRPAR